MRNHPFSAAILAALLFGLVRWLYLRHGDRPRVFWTTAVLPLLLAIGLTAASAVTLAISSVGEPGVRPAGSLS